MLGNLLNKLKGNSRSFKGSENYWIKRYNAGGNSGNGSYNQLAEFKAEVLNEFVKKHEIKNVIEFGCGDGNQLKLASYPEYIGYDVSPVAVSVCKEMFELDSSKAFKLMSEYAEEIATLSLSLDVLYHLVEDDVFNEYMNRLFDLSEKFVIIYSSNTNEKEQHAAHVRHRAFSEWVDQNKPDFKLCEFIKNKYPDTGDNKISSFADFYIYEKC